MLIFFNPCWHACYYVTVLTLIFKKTQSPATYTEAYCTGLLNYCPYNGLVTHVSGKRTKYSLQLKGGIPDPATYLHVIPFVETSAQIILTGYHYLVLLLQQEPEICH